MHKTILVFFLIFSLLFAPCTTGVRTASAEPITLGTVAAMAATAGAISAAFSACVYVSDCVIDGTSFDMTDFCTSVVAGFVTGFGAAFAMILGAALAAGGAFAAGVASILSIPVSMVANDHIVSEAVSEKITPWVRPVVESVFNGQTLYDGMSTAMGFPRFSTIKMLAMSLADKVMDTPEMTTFSNDLVACGSPAAALVSITTNPIRVQPGGVQNNGTIPAEDPFTIIVELTDFDGAALSDVSASGLLLRKDGGLDMQLSCSVRQQGANGQYEITCDPRASLMNGQYALVLTLSGTSSTGTLEQGVQQTVFVGGNPMAAITACSYLLLAESTPVWTGDYVVQIDGVKYYPDVKLSDPDCTDRVWNTAQCTANNKGVTSSYKDHAGGYYPFAEYMCEARGLRLPTVEEMQKLYNQWHDNFSYDNDIAPTRHHVQGRKMYHLETNSSFNANWVCTNVDAYVVCVQ